MDNHRQTPTAPSETPISSREKHERDRDNLRRLGCCMILYSYEELRRWCRPKEKYSHRQQRILLRGEDPLADLYQFFFGEDGVDEVLEAFDIKLTLETVRRVIKPVFAEAQACIDGRPVEVQKSLTDADMDLLMEAMGSRLESATGLSEEPDEEEAL